MIKKQTREKKKKFKETKKIKLKISGSPGGPNSVKSGWKPNPIAFGIENKKNNNSNNFFFLD